MAGSHLLILCSKLASTVEAYEVARRLLPEEKVSVVELPQNWSVPHLALRAEGVPPRAWFSVDTAAKRNAALLIARAVGWRAVLFLDDDVRGFGATHMQAVERALDSPDRGLEALGWAFDDHPDNSMVCHAYRLAGGHQSTFIGGGALAVRVSPWTPHFPDVYNEDWLFMLVLMLRSRSALAFAGSMRQAPFDPFAIPEHADRQEFGDVLAEGLFRLLHTGQPLSVARSGVYWGEQLRLRQIMIERILARFASHRCGHLTSVQLALERALDFNRTMRSWPPQLAEWVLAWEGDCRTWRQRMVSTGPASLDRALADLGLMAHRPAVRARR
jgi:hypothetical protein